MASEESPDDTPTAVIDAVRGDPDGTETMSIPRVSDDELAPEVSEESDTERTLTNMEAVTEEIPAVERTMDIDMVMEAIPPKGSVLEFLRKFRGRDTRRAPKEKKDRRSWP